MKLTSALILALCPLVISACGSNNSSAPEISNQGDSALITTQGGNCATQFRNHFKGRGHKTGFSTLTSGTYVYDSSETLFIGENSSRDEMTEAYFTGSSDSPTANVTCHFAHNIAEGENTGHLNLVHFPLKLEISSTGDLVATTTRYAGATESGSNFTADFSDQDLSKNASNSVLRGADQKSASDPNQRIEVWQDSDGRITLVIHQGSQGGSSKATIDSLVHYSRVTSKR